MILEADLKTACQAFSGRISRLSTLRPLTTHVEALQAAG